MDPEQQGAEERFRRLFEAYYGDLVRFAARRVGPDAARDVVSNTFLVAWRRLADVPTDRPLAWLYATARRVVAEELRAGARRERLFAKAAAQAGPGDADPAEPVSERLRVRAVLAALRPGDQEILRLAQWERLTIAETAAVLGCSTMAAKVRLHRAQQRFAAQLLASEAALCHQRPTAATPKCDRSPIR